MILICILSGCQNNTNGDNAVMHRLCERLFPQHSDHFIFQCIKDTTSTDWYSVESIDGKIQICGNNNNSLAVGLNHYLKYYCHTNVSWYADDEVKMPESLPEVKGGFKL